MKRQLWKRAPLVIAVVVGAFLWRGGLGLLPTDRTLVFELDGPAADVRDVEVQVWSGDTLLTRNEWAFPNGVDAEISRKLALRAGDYTARAFVKRQGINAPRASAATLHVG